MITLNGCATDSGSYHDNKTYPSALYGNITKRSFAYEGPARNPVIVIHGLLGARLEDTAKKENIWGNFALSEMMSGGKFGRLAHPMQKGKPLKDIHNSVQATGLLEKAEILVMGVQLQLDNYDILVKTLEDCGYVPNTKPLPKNKHFYSQFIFYYDWRRDISENAVELEKFIQKQRTYLQKEYERLYGIKDYDVQFDLIAHSMGGLLARYFVRYGGTLLPEKEEENLPVTWKGGEYVDKVIIIGTPNAAKDDNRLEAEAGTATNDDGTFNITVGDTKHVGLPLTGLNGVTFTWIAGGAVLCIGVAHLIRSRKQAVRFFRTGRLTASGSKRRPDAPAAGCGGPIRRLRVRPAPHKLCRNSLPASFSNAYYTAARPYRGEQLLGICAYKYKNRAALRLLQRFKQTVLRRLRHFMCIVYYKYPASSLVRGFLRMLAKRAYIIGRDAFF